MGLLRKLFRRQRASPPEPLEALLQQFSDDADLADRMIEGASEGTRIELAICLACLQSAYESTARLRASFNELPSLDPQSKIAFPFDAVVEETFSAPLRSSFCCVSSCLISFST